MIKVSEMIKQLSQCHPNDTVIVSFAASDAHSHERKFGGALGVSEITDQSIGEVVILAEGD